MIEFKKVEIEDREWVQPLLDYSGYNCLEYSFTFTYLWRNIFKYRIARVNDYLVLKSVRKNYPVSYLFPAGRGDIDPVLDMIYEDAKTAGEELVFHTLIPEHKEILEKKWPGKFEYIDLEDYYDYIYETEKLITLSGKKLASKRNHINRFKDNNPDWSYETITEDNIAEVVEMNRKWVSLENTDTSTSFAQEASSVEEALKHFFALKLKGGLIRSDGEVIAFSLADRLNDNMLLIHIEKAFKEIQGAYTIINQQFAEHEGKDYKYINREDDSGNPGLRKAKRSYRPVFMAEKMGAKMPI